MKKIFAKELGIGDIDLSIRLWGISASLLFREIQPLKFVMNNYVKTI